MRKSLSSNNRGRLPRYILQLQSTPVAVSGTYLPAGAMLSSLRGENPEGPTYKANVSMQSFGSLVQDVTIELIQANGKSCSSIHHHGFITNTTAQPTTLGEQAIKISCDPGVSMTAYYLV